MLQIADQEGMSEVTTIDLMRGHEALNLVALTQAKEIEEIIFQVIHYEEKLVELKDVASHTVSEVLSEELGVNQVNSRSSLNKG